MTPSTIPFSPLSTPSNTRLSTLPTPTTISLLPSQLTRADAAAKKSSLPRFPLLNIVCRRSLQTMTFHYRVVKDFAVIVCANVMWSSIMCTSMSRDKIEIPETITLLLIGGYGKSAILRK
ncbi:hypothetical protein FCM35_KLT07290 [Carex littledalei]|uniref:Uncharacterized protein n=1 Tax=Carex littledalei TaxID=544730 RepID=A0A833QTC8_9POAL|nr:hypothetical protein FCM35_KLT07290 [Carex littledalei]